MSKYYIAGIFQEEDGSGYSVYFPDVPNVCAGGETMEEAIENASDGLQVALQGMADDNIAIPEPSNLANVKKCIQEFHSKIGMPCPAETVYQYFPAPVIDMTPVRVNVTIPKSILAEIDRNAKLAGLTRSRFLVAAAQAFTS